MKIDSISLHNSYSLTYIYIYKEVHLPTLLNEIYDKMKWNGKKIFFHWEFAEEIYDLKFYCTFSDKSMWEFLFSFYFNDIYV